MTFRRLIVLSVIACGLVGCGVSEVRKAQMDNPTIICVNETDCTEKWQKAEVWVTNNSKWRIQRASNTVIQTYGPDSTSANTAFKITKVPIGGGRHEIRIEAWCNNLFGCFPKPADAQSNFYYYIR